MKRDTVLPPGKNYKGEKNYDAESPRVRKYPDERPDANNKQNDRESQRQRRDDIYYNPEVDVDITNSDQQQSIY